MWSSEPGVFGVVGVGVADDVGINLWITTYPFSRSSAPTK